MKQQAPGLNPARLSSQELRKKLDELFDDPMGMVVASSLLLAPAYQEIVVQIRREYGLKEVPPEPEERMRWVKKKLTKKEQGKIWNKTYKLVCEMDEFRDIAERAVEVSKIIPRLEDIMALHRKRGRPPNNKRVSWPQADITDTVVSWAILRCPIPLPDYFYDPRRKMSKEGLSVTLPLLQTIGEGVLEIGKEDDSLKADKKRHRDTLDRDAYYYLLKHEGPDKRDYADVATYVLQEGLCENSIFTNEEDKEKEREKLSRKIAAACKRYELYLSQLVARKI